MIEQINGTGLSGLFGKSGKNAKSGLFAKLMAIFEKQAEGKGKGLLGAEMSDPLAARKKGAQLLHLAEKNPLALKGMLKQGDEEMHAAVAAAIFLAGNPEKVTTKQKGETGFVIEKAELSAGKEKADKGEKGTFTIEKPDLKADGKLADGKGSEKGALNGDAEGKEKVQLSTEKATANIQQEKGEKSVARSDATPASEKSEMSARQPKEGDLAQQARFTVDKPQGTEQRQPTATATVQSSNSDVDTDAESMIASAGKQAKESIKQGSEGAATTLNTAAESQSRTQHSSRVNYAATQQIKGDEVELSSSTSESEAAPLKSTKSGSQPVVAAAQHQAKQLNTQQANQATQTASVSAVQSGVTDTQLTDSGNQGSSDKGAGDQRAMSGLQGDSRANSSSQTGNSQFQSYLNGKPSPSMSVFDSMKHVAQSAHNGHTKLEIQLEPAHLGRIQITLQTDASKQVQVHMVVDQGGTRAAIEQQLPILRSALAQQGFDLSGFSMDQQGQQSGFGTEGGNGSQRQLADASDSEIQSQQNQATDSSAPRSSQSGLSIRV